MPGPEEAGQRRLQRLVAAARTALAWEDIWRAAAPVLAILGLFLAVSWAGAWQILPHWARALGVAVFVIATLFALLREARLSWPSRPEALARLDRDSGVLH